MTPTDGNTLNKEDETMRVFANFLIDRFLEEQNKNPLKIVVNENNLSLGDRDDDGTQR